MDKDLENRVEQLEIEIAHAANTIEELNGVVIEQSKQIDRLTRLLSQTTDQVEEFMDHFTPGHQSERPPHY